MYQDIHCMIPEHIKTMEMVIQRESKICYKTSVVKIPNHPYIFNITDGHILGYRRSIIKMKTTIETVRIDDDPEYADQE